jgi:hypothetical protein
MNPYLRPLDSTAPIPQRLDRRTRRTWNGHEVEVVSNPTRHDVMLVGSAADDIDNTDLEHIGFQFVATDGQTWLWYRDRLAAAPQQPRTNTGSRGGPEHGHRALSKVLAGSASRCPARCAPRGGDDRRRRGSA